MYNQYYTAADSSVFLVKNNNMLLLDKVNGIMITEELSSYPIYGLGNSYFGFTTKGNYVVNGFIDINVIHTAYMTNAINYLESNPEEVKQASKAIKRLSNKKDIISMSIDELIDDKKRIFLSENATATAIGDGIAYLKSGFGIMLKLNNTSQLRKDGTSSELMIYNCRLIGSDISSSVNDESQIVRRYKFIGQAINERSA